MKKNLMLFVLIILTVIGYATVNTVLDIKNNINISENNDDFRIEITNLKINNNDNKNLISKDKQSFTFIGSGNDTINYTVTNYSYQYDANVILVCTPNNNIIVDQINNIPAQDRLTKSISNTNTKEITCTINIEKVSRTEYAEDLCKIEEGTEWAFNYTGSEQEFVVPCDGEYKIELWGAEGGSPNNSYPGGKGAFVSGTIYLPMNNNLYIYVGSSGQLKNPGYNGGGTGGDFVNKGRGSGGGGATDIRLKNGKWNDFNSLKTRIMIAAGGGGGAYYGDSTGSWGYMAGINGSGGGLTGNRGHYKFIVYDGRWDSGVAVDRENIGGFGATQVAGGKAGYGYIGSGVSGSFAQGGSCNLQGAAAGGGGYYGGGSSARNGFSGGGGSSFISGHNGCNAISENSTQTKIVHTGQPNHYSGLIFNNTLMLAGNESMPSKNEDISVIGNSGNGYAKITYLGK